MEKKIQTIIFPADERFYFSWKLFYKGSRGNLDREQQLLRIGQYQQCDFTTYLNGCSYRKWKRYTNLLGIKLQLEIEGNFKIVLVGYHLDIERPVKKEFVSQEYNLDNRQIIEITYPENEEQIIGFEIYTYNSCIIYGGAYIGAYEGSDVRNVTLALAITTCKKEEFIISNMEVLKREILRSKDGEIRDNIYIHVVDNGRTLKPEEWNKPHLIVHPNKNTGGSGGFARGMLEAMHQAPVATNVLLMDDDVIILPESIRRTYILLTLLKPEYQNHFISGAMLYYENMCIQHEDIGTISLDTAWRSLKPRLYHDCLKDNLINELDFLKHPNEYAGWWYCCIPMGQIKKNGLPLPVFIRGDDVEFSLRCKAKILTMNGICIWHMGFENKYNAAIDKYQECRNMLIGEAAFNVFQGSEKFKFWDRSFKIELMKFNYDAAELVLRAMEDFMKGPLFLEEDRGEQIIKENREKNEKLVPLSELNVIEINFNDLYHDSPRKFIDKCIYYATKNGQRFWPEKWLKKERAFIPFDSWVAAQKQTLRRELVSVNPYLKTGAVRKIDKKRFKEVYKRYKKDLQEYKKNHVTVENAYKDKAQYLVSEEFWMKYLGIAEGR